MAASGLHLVCVIWNVNLHSYLKPFIEFMWTVTRKMTSLLSEIKKWIKEVPESPRSGIKKKVEENRSKK